MGGETTTGNNVDASVRGETRELPVGVGTSEACLESSSPVTNGTERTSIVCP